MKKVLLSLLLVFALAAPSQAFVFRILAGIQLRRAERQLAPVFTEWERRNYPKPPYRGRFCERYHK